MDVYIQCDVFIKTNLSETVIILILRTLVQLPLETTTASSHIVLCFISPYCV